MNQKIYTNPISKTIVKAVKATEQELLIAVPFMTGYAKKILTKESLAKIKSKKLLTRFNEKNEVSFDLDTMKYLLENNVEIRYNNDIHLKLYLFDKNGFLSSSNLTNSGFEKSIEITSTIEEENISKCKTFFNELWEESKDNQVTEALIEENYSKYLFLKKNSQQRKQKKLIIRSKKISISNLEIDDLVNYIFKSKYDFSHLNDDVLSANQDRAFIKNKVKKGFQLQDFYAPVGHEKREDSLYYRFMYGREGDIAGTGLRESQIKQAFEHESFQETISYIYPPIIGKEEWNLADDDTFQKYCNGIFSFKIPQYVETLPIRLASYFYHQDILPVFKLSHLEQVCNTLGIETDAQSKGDKLYAYNKFLLDKLKLIPLNNYYAKSHIIYLLYFTVELYKKLEEEDYESILKSHKEKWKKNYLQEGKVILEKLKST